MKIAISGTTGLIGSALVEYFSKGGHEILALKRPASRSATASSVKDVIFDYRNARTDAQELEGLDAVIHLAGAGIAAKRWTPKYKKTILESRVQSTRFLAQTLSALNVKPKVFLVASAVGYYGVHPFDVELSEGAAPGEGFLADVCRQWEAAADPAREAGIRTVHMRFGAVLSGKGGALAKMLPVFRLGLGGPIGSGEQPMSWVALPEIPHIIGHLIAHENISGAVNCVCPQAVSNAEFTEILGQALHRPAVLPLPAFAVRLMFGEMGQELLLKGQNVVPARFQESGYGFRYGELRFALKQVLGGRASQ